MNKLLIFPLMVMLLISMTVIVFADQINDPQAVGVNYTGTDISSQSVNWASPWLMIGFALAIIALSVIMGVNVFGSGFSDMSQRLVFNASFYIGLWIALSSVSYNVIFQNDLFILVWIGLTLMFLIGFGVQAGGHTD